MSNHLELGFFKPNRIELVRQTEVAECGLACLTMIANYHGAKTGLSTLRRRFQPSLRGLELKSLIAMADQLALTSRPVKLPLEQLEALHMPAILHWDLNHFVVLERIEKGKALIQNPASQSRWYKLAELSKHFTGVALELRPADNFNKIGYQEKLKISQLWRRITGLKRAILQTIALSIVLEAFVLASPYYMQIAVDNVLPARDANLLTVLAIGFGLFTLINAGASLLRSFVLLSAGTSIGFGISTNIARRLFRLEIDWFEKRHVGDILSRFQSVTPIQQFLTQGAVGALLDGSLSILALIVMFFYSPSLAGVAVVAFGLYLAVRITTYAVQKNSQESVIIAQAKEQSTLIELLRGITTLRLYNRETERHAYWQSKLMDSMNSSISLTRINTWQSTANTLIFGLENIIATWMAIHFVIQGGFSVGMVYAYITYKTQFLQRSASLVDQLTTFRMLDVHLSRLSDIALSKQDRSFEQTDGAKLELQGRMELRNISFRYSPTDAYVLNNVNLTIEAGEHIAITGPSGGGKTTLLKIMLGLLEPSSGEILIDDIPLLKFGYKHYHEQLGAVLQEDSLFTGSLAENIALFDETLTMADVIKAATDAAIHDDITAMPMGYETYVGDMGSTLSGGQKQRLLLARALYRKPRILLMDEGTSHLDPLREQMVNHAISKLGITRIVIAHRQESVLLASKVYEVANNNIQLIDK